MTLAAERPEALHRNEIKLTDHNLFVAGIIGCSRHVKGAKKQGQFGVNNATLGWQINCDGACGEMALAKWLGVWYDGALGDFTAADVGNYEVRTNPNEWGDLILREKDPDTSVFVLVLSHNAPRFLLRGWMYGYEGKQERYYRSGSKHKQEDRPKAFFVPQRALKPMEELPR